MKKTIYFLTALLSFVLFTNCSSDDGNNSTYPESVTGTTWYRQETVNQSGQSVTIDFHLVFETNNTGYLEAETNSAGGVVQTYSFDYTYSQGHGNAVFDDPNIGNQDFTVNGNILTLDGENLTRQ